MFIHAIDPVLLRLGPLQIRYYGVLFVIAILLGYWILRKQAREKEINMEIIEEYLLFLILGIIIGARLFHVIVYQAGYYFADPVRILYIWRGGLASHGAVLGAILVTWWFSRKKSIPFYTLADLIALPIAVGSIFIRIGNFINGEIVGRVTNVPWAVQFQGYDGFRHPSQLYEAAKNVIVSGIMWRLTLLKNLPPGFLFWSLLVAHSTLRFLVEFFKDYQTSFEPILGVFTMGQVISLIVVIGAGIMLWKTWKSGKQGKTIKQE